MEKIVINNFLIFKNVDLDIKKFNILIGPQASGKSLLAKLVYYFRNISVLMRRGIHNEVSFDNFIEDIEEVFLDFFPSQYWSSKKKFNIQYINNDFSITIKSDYRKKFNISILLSDNISNFYRETTSLVKEIKKKIILESEFTSEVDNSPDNTKIEINKHITDSIRNSAYSDYFKDSIFIPASRSFFSTINKNLWTLTDQDIINIDPFFSRFGRAYEQTKSLYNFIREHGDGLGERFFEDYNLSIDFLNKILKGEYLQIDDEDWIKGNDYNVSLSRASSGQQESLPMLMVLIVNATRKVSQSKQFFIEEPEAHLFPSAQNDIVSLFLNLKIKRNVDFFITTHSPYILSALNNSIYANELVKKDKISISQYLKMSDGAYPIDFNDISAYSLENGVLTDIKDSEYKMIGGDILDSVSNEFGTIMDTLMELDD